MTECALPFSVTHSYILSFQDANDIKASLKDIIGNESVANRIATEILKSRGQVGILVFIRHTLVGSEGRENNRLKAKAIRRKRHSERIDNKCILFCTLSWTDTNQITEYCIGEDRHS